jgi:hypothetical protein
MRNANTCPFRKAALNDLEDKCFISSIDRFTFNSYPGEWEKRRGGQYAWHYIHYTSYLFEKPSEDYTGLENSVSECLKTHDISFLPIESLVLQQRVEFANELERGESQEESLRQEMSQLREEMALLQSHQKVQTSINPHHPSSIIPSNLNPHPSYFQPSALIHHTLKPQPSSIILSTSSPHPSYFQPSALIHHIPQLNPQSSTLKGEMTHLDAPDA